MWGKRFREVGFEDRDVTAGRQDHSVVEGEVSLANASALAAAVVNALAVEGREGLGDGGVEAAGDWRGGRARATQEEVFAVECDDEVGLAVRPGEPRRGRRDG